jgi:peptide/nickel transport system ATP-binding protein
LSNRSPLLEIRGLSVDYEREAKNILALDDVNLSIDSNTVVAVVGESGCGKSTLALSIIGLLPIPPAKIHSGEMHYKSVDLLRVKERERRLFRGTEIAMIFQEPLTSLNPVYRVGDQVAEAISIRKLREKDGSLQLSADGPMQKVYNTKSRLSTSRFVFPFRSRYSGEIRREVVDMLRKVRIPDPEQIVNRYPFELSGGMRQRIMIAMALSQKPSLLIADEPTTALDVTTQAQVLKLMKELMDEARTSVLLITHDLGVASEVADRVIVMYAGDVIEDTDVYKLFKEPLHPYTKGLLSCIPSGPKDIRKITPIPGSIPDMRNPPPGCKFSSRCPYVMETCRTTKPPLIQVSKNHKVACFLYPK